MAGKQLFMSPMRGIPTIRKIAKSGLVFLLGREKRPRTIVRGVARGYRICVSPAENLGYLIGTFEPHLQRAIKEYVTAGDTVYDIGANVGYASLSLAKRVGPEGYVFAFEPLPANVKALRQNIEVNRLTNVRILEVAVSDKCGEASIRVAENDAMASLVWHRDNPSAAKMMIRTMAIDDFVETSQIPVPKFVKIDVEGAEGQVLLGMRHTLVKARPVVFLECSDAGRETTWKVLSDLGYRCESALTRKAIRIFEHYRHADFLWIP
ncbi:MAG TPA: FkbM family methyltransferase [Terriglobales bacterium]|jgi:FkbM family methyltransferase